MGLFGRGDSMSPRLTSRASIFLGLQRLKRIHGDDHTYRMARNFDYRGLAEGPLAKLPSSKTQQVRLVDA